MGEIKTYLWVFGIFCAIALFWTSRLWPATQVVSEIEENLADRLIAQDSDLKDFQTEFSEYTNPFAINHDVTFSKRVFLNGQLIYWTDNQYFPEYADLKREDSLFFFENRLGKWVVKRNDLPADQSLIEIFSILPLKNQPPVSNQYLQDELNPKLFGGFNIEIRNDGTYQIRYKGIDLFTISVNPQSTIIREQISFMLLTFLVTLIFILGIKYKLLDNWLLLIASMLMIRLIIYFYTSTQVNLWKMFNPVVFTTGFLNPTLGDFFLNQLLVFVFLLYAFLRIDSVKIYFEKFKAKIWFIGLVVILNLLAVHFLYNNIWSLLEHSQIGIDISQSVSFDHFRIVAYLSILFNAFSFLLVYTISQAVLKPSASIRKTIFVLFTVIAIAVFFLGSYSVVVYTMSFVVLWIIVDLFKLNQYLNRISYLSFVYLVVVFVQISIVAGTAIYKHQEKDDLITKQKFVNHLLIKNDILGEYYLNEIKKDIEQDRFIRTRMMSKVLARQNIKDKIMRQYFTSYFNKYQVDILLFDKDGIPLEIDNAMNYQSKIVELERDFEETDYDGIYLNTLDSANSLTKYACTIEIGAYNRTVGHIVFDLTLKKFIPESVFPELLLESKYYLSNEYDFNYVVYRENELLYKQGNFNPENQINTADLNNPALYENGIERRGLHLYGFKTSDGRNIVVVSDTYTAEAFLANVSFFFMVFVFCVGLAFVILSLFIPRARLNLSTKIQLFLGISFALPLLIVIIALNKTLNDSYRDEIDRSYQKTSLNLAENLIDVTEAFYNNKINRDQLANLVVQAASLLQSDVNIYDQNGELTVTSQPEIFNARLLSELIDPAAFNKIKYKREQSLISESSIGTLDFKTSYVGIRSYTDGRLLAILSVPYFDSKNHLKRQQIDVFDNLIIIFSSIFFVFLVGGNVIIIQLVKPLKSLGSKLRETSLQEINQPIIYESDDEIGSLVSEYNAMLVKLEDSKEALAQSQKESAWKEIARQVAHEIKNPLTPMRLKIQQMMRNNESDTKMYSTCESLITQVDSLSSIADSFSEFAKMPAPNNEVVEIVSLINRTLDLYHSSEVRIKKNMTSERIHVFLDPNIFSRSITNVFLNAIQAHDESTMPVVEINVSVNGNKALIEISDQGKGISEDQKDKIFTPYFSTKVSGSGIGLAVVKKSIENAGGNIWFESKEGKGTTFFISLPLYHT